MTYICLFTKYFEKRKLDLFLIIFFFSGNVERTDDEIMVVYKCSGLYIVTQSYDGMASHATFSIKVVNYLVSV